MDVMKSHLLGYRPPNKNLKHCTTIISLISIQIAAFLALTPRNSIENWRQIGEKIFTYIVP